MIHLEKIVRPVICLPEGGIVRSNSFRKKGLVDLGALREDRGAEGDSETAPKVSHEVEDSGCVAHLLHGDVKESCRGKGNKKQPKAKPLDQPRQGYRVKVRLEVEIRHHP